MFSTKTLSLLTLLALSGLTIAHDGSDHEEVTTTSTEIVYVTVTQTRALTGTEDPYTVLVTPPVPTPTVTEDSDDSESTYTTPTIEIEEAPYPTETDVVEVPLNGTTSTLAPSGGYSTTLRLNETVYSTSDPSMPAPTEDDESAAVMGVQVGMKSLLALAGMVGAGMFML